MLTADLSTNKSTAMLKGPQALQGLHTHDGLDGIAVAKSEVALENRPGLFRLSPRSFGLF